MKNLVQMGKVISFTASEDLNSGDLIIIGSIAAVVANDVLTGQDGEAQIMEVFKVPKVTGAGTALVNGGPVNYITATKSATGATPGAGLGNTGIGVAVGAAGDSADFVNVLLNANISTAT